MAVHVGNLAWETQSADLRDHMEQAGQVHSCKIAIESSGRSRGWGLVEFDSQGSANRAVRELDGSVLDGREIAVKLDEHEQPAPRGAPRGGGGAVGNRVYVGNLNFRTQWQELKDHFRQAGDVVHAEVVDGWGLVEFSNSRDARNAIQMLNDVELDGRPLNVREDREEGAGGGARGGRYSPYGGRQEGPRAFNRTSGRGGALRRY